MLNMLLSDNIISEYYTLLNTRKKKHTHTQSQERKKKKTTPSKNTLFIAEKLKSKNIKET